MYKIASTPGFNVGRFEYAAQYEFLSKRTTLLESVLCETRTRVPNLTSITLMYIG
jgi:hypothetical protein